MLIVNITVALKTTDDRQNVLVTLTKIGLFVKLSVILLLSQTEHDMPFPVCLTEKLTVKCSKSSGPGGQNVNKGETNSRQRRRK